MKTGVCQLCEHEGKVTFHHLIPRTVHKKREFKRRYSRDELARGVDLCPRCHKMVHRAADERTLGREHNTLEGLLAHPVIARYARWARSHPSPSQRAFSGAGD